MSVLTQSKEQDLLLIGKVGAPFGVKGWVRIQSFAQEPKSILNYSPLFIGKSGAWRICEIEGSRKNGSGVIAKFKNCEDRDKADLLKGQNIAIKRESLPKLGDDQYYWADLEGMHVKNMQNETLGIVDYLYEVPLQDILVVKGEGKKRLHIPFLVDEIVKNVCLKSKEIIVDWDYKD